MAEIRDGFVGKTVLVTGGSGLIGAALIEYLLGNPGVRVVGAGRSEAKFSRFSTHSNFKYLKYDATGEFESEDDADVIVHAASAASPDLYLTKPVETMLANIAGINEILKYAVGRQCKIVYVSSSEVYGNAEPRINGFVETDGGYVDLLNPRSSYPMGKRAAETLCASYCAEYGVDVSIVRPGHIYGPTATESDMRVSSLWPRQAAKGEDIEMKSEGTQVRSYTHSYDCATAILTVALHGRSGEVYNIANPSVVCSIRQLAEEVALAGGVKLISKCPTAKDLAAFNPMDNSRIDAAKLVGLGWKPIYDVHSGIMQTIREIKCRMR